MLRKKTYTFTSIFGLGLGMACCLLIILFVTDELSYDRYHTKHSRIYRLATNMENSTFGGIAKVNGPWGPAAKAEIPEVEAMTRLVFVGQMLFTQGSQRFYENSGFYADSNVFKIFDYQFIAGNPGSALTQPNAIVITNSIKEKYFGDQSALGLTLQLENREFMVTGVVEDIPLNSHFTFTYLIPMSSLEHPQRDSWIQWNQFYTYLLLHPDAPAETVASKMKFVLEKNLDAESAAHYTPFLQPIASIHLYSHLFREMNPNSDVTYIYIFSSIALLILVISCANFVNLTTAQAATRAREIGVRKVNGAVRKQLVIQFLTEASIICLLALCVAQVLATLSLPLLNTLTGKALHFNYLVNPTMLIMIIAIAALTALLAGSYPAVYLSSLKPAQAIKGKWAPAGTGMLRKGLVTFQFTLSSLLVIACAIILQQLHFIQRKPLGFDPQQIITIPIQSNTLRTNYTSVKKQLMDIPGVQQVSITGNLPGGGDWGIPALAEGFTNDNMPPMRVMVIDTDFIETYGMELASGRGFTDQLASDSSAYLINEEAAQQLMWTDPLSKTFSMPAINRPAGQVVGVVKDFHFRSFREKIGALLFFIPPSAWYSLYSIKLDAANMQETIKAIEIKWAELDPEHLFTYSFFDQSFNALYNQEQRLSQIVNYFTGIGVFLACLGLYSLASISTEHRTKEIGIRKAIGATNRQIVVMLSKQYLALVVIGFAAALPLALWMLNRWLQTFAYHVDFSVLIILASCLITMAVALLTVGYRSLLAAHANPVDSLRNE